MIDVFAGLKANLAATSSSAKVTTIRTALTAALICRSNRAIPGYAIDLNHYRKPESHNFFAKAGAKTRKDSKIRVVTLTQHHYQEDAMKIKMACLSGLLLTNVLGCTIDNKLTDSGNTRSTEQVRPTSSSANLSEAHSFAASTPAPQPGITNTSAGTKIAFVGDTAAGQPFQQVLNLIKAEGTQLTILLGDTSYSYRKDKDWDEMVKTTLGPSDPVLVVAGNHDYGDSEFNEIRNFGQIRLDKQPKVQCKGSYAENMTCTFNNLYFVMSAIASKENSPTAQSRAPFEAFITNSLKQAPPGAWRICAWHKNQHAMQVGRKGNEVGWTAYETCREKAAIIATGHEHSYSRTHLLGSMEKRTVISRSNQFELKEGQTFAFVSGLGGREVRDQAADGNGDWWAKIYTNTQNAKYGVLFGTFYSDHADFYFKNIAGEVIDTFSVKKGY